MLSFIKMHGLGNDFVILDFRKGGALPDPDAMHRLADRRRGVGCDQIVVLCPAKDVRAFCFMKIFNADGSEAGACGNATRCVARLIFEETGQDSCMIETRVGLLFCQKNGKDRICVNMGIPHFDWERIPLSRACDTLHLPLDVDAAAVSMGNPHCVVFVDSLEDIPVERIGSSLENNALFPERTNVEFLQILAPDRLRLRVWERGAGLTPACGSGACAALAAAVRRERAAREAEVILDGGSLTVSWNESSGCVLMTGGTSYVFGGVLGHDPI